MVGCQQPSDGQTPCQIMHPDMQLQQVSDEHDSTKELRAFKIFSSNQSLPAKEHRQDEQVLHVGEYQTAPNASDHHVAATSMALSVGGGFIYL